MYGRMKNWSMVAGLMFSTAATSYATEPFVQDFDGWKITIRPGVSSMADVPPAPRPLAAPAADRSTGRIQLISLQQEITPPVPQPDGPPVIDATPKPLIRPQAQPQPDLDVLEGFPRIIPGESDCCNGKTVVNPPEGTVDPRYMAQMYTEIYKSIPFIRAEYDGNPTYIHDTTVEFLFGKMRPTVINRDINTHHHRHWGGFGGYGGYGGYGVPFAYGGAGFGLNGYGWNGGAGYAYPPLQLVVPGTGLRIHRLN